MSDEKLVFAFDLGTGSIGECVRRGKEVKHLSSLLLPEDYASTTTQAERRHLIRAREAHKARENWWRNQAQIAGIAVLETRQPSKENPGVKPDRRMLKEFPSDDDNTVYTSCLLRIALLQGRKLESWQVFKAVWSAMQHRGYDSALPWAREVQRRAVDDSGNKRNENAEITSSRGKNIEDEAKNRESLQEYVKYLRENFGNREEYWYPCYYEAHKLGIWSLKHPNDLSGKIGTNPPSFRGRVAPRELVVKELKELLRQAARQFPKLKGKEDYIIFGPAEEPYASFKNGKFRQFRGKEWDWQGLLGQKVPRFDNRIIDKCRLIPRLNVCKSNEMLNREFVFLSKLKNMRYVKGSSTAVALSPAQVRTVFEKFKLRLGDAQKAPSKETITEKKWDALIKEDFGGRVNPAHVLVEGPRVGGRSCYCRPALRILKEILLSGKSPRQLHAELIEENKKDNPSQEPNKGLVRSDFDFLLRMPPEWESFAIPDERTLDHQLAKPERGLRIAQIINGVRNPVVRHRLGLFVKRLGDMTRRNGEPDMVVLEFIRESFMGEKQKREYEAFVRENSRRRDKAMEKLRDIKIKGKDALVKVLLFEEQKGMDAYGLEKLSLSQLDEYEIDHIVPRSKGGPDTFYNKVLVTRENNKRKGNRTPYEWLFGTEKWAGFIQALEENKAISLKKKALLTAEDSLQMVERLASIAETAYIAKLTQRIVALYYGWDWQTEGSKRKIRVVSGGQTAQLRRKYGLDRLLHPEMPDIQWQELLGNGKIDEKNRDNKKHHALDALVLSMVPELKLNLRTKEDDLPAWFHKIYCGKELEKVIPRNIAFEKPVLAETVYGMRVRREGNDTKCYMVSRTSLRDYLKEITKAKSKIESIYDLNIKERLKAKIMTSPSQAEWERYLNHFVFAGSSPKKVFVTENKKGADAPKELKHFKEFSQYGQYFTDKREHKGYVVYSDEKDCWQVEPVYVFESMFRKVQILKNKYGKSHFFRSGMLVSVRENCNQGTKFPVQKGIYNLNSILMGRQVVLSSNTDSKRTFQVGLQTLMQDGHMEVYSE